MNTLSAYKIMWLQVIFDLPTGSKKERREATLFRNSLLDNGFNMLQYSVYIRSCADKNISTRISSVIKKSLPKYGKVSILTFTDKQFENMESFYQKKKDDKEISGLQMEFF